MGPEKRCEITKIYILYKKKEIFLKKLSIFMDTQIKNNFL